MKSNVSQTKAQNESFKNVVSTGVVPVCFILMYKKFNNGAVLQVSLRNCGRKSINFDESSLSVF